MVDALGGVDVNVEHEMHYDDNWGHLHVHLKPGFQHLNGDQAVGFARYRHGNAGTRSPRRRTATSGACTASTSCCAP